MAAALPIVAIAGTLLSASAYGQQGAAIKKQAERKRAEAEFEAQQLDIDAGQAKAVSQRAAADVETNARLINSTALARAAASGAGASDPTVMNIIAKTSGMGAYRSGVALYEGESQARLDHLRAQALRMSGDAGIKDANAASKSADTLAAATIFSGGATAGGMYQKYWSGPSAASTVPAARTGWLDTGGDQIRDVG